VVSLGRFLIRRIIYLVLVLLGISTILFVLLRVSGDPITVLLGPDNPSPEAERALRAAYGLDRPLYIQYFRFLMEAARLHFGESLQTGQDALQLVVARLPASGSLAVAAALLATLVSLPVGIYAAVRRNSPLTSLLMVGALIGQSTPVFALGILLILVFAVNLHWLPSIGNGSWRHMVLPAITLSGFMMAKLARMVRSGMLEVLSQDYVRTARAKGLPLTGVVLKHGLRNMLIPVVTILGMEISYLLGGAVIVETVFAWPGLGRQMLGAVLARDYAVVQATVFVVAAITVLVNLLVDLMYHYLDPRVSYS
jgi:peptide/nickel transport system permease protein